jgi:hypothetical protein
MMPPDLREASMFDFTEMMKHAQGGQAMLNLARHFGITPEQTSKVVEALMPAFIAGMQRQFSDPAASMKLMQAMFGQSGPTNPYFDPMAAFKPETVSQGEEMLGHFFGSKEVSKAVADHVANMTGIGQQILTSMMPVVAAMTAGGLAETPWGKMMAPFLGAGGGAAKAPTMPDFSAFFSPKAAEAGMADMMKAWGTMVPGFSPDKMAEMLKTTPNPAGPGSPFGEMMGEFLKGLHKTPAPEPEPEAPKTMFDQMFQAGREAQDSQTQAYEEIFDRFWGNKTGKKKPAK